MVVFVWWCLCGGVFVVVFESSQHIVRVIRAKVQSIKVVTNHSIGTCSVDLYILYLFETSGTASCGTTGIFLRFLSLKIFEVPYPLSGRGLWFVNVFSLKRYCSE